jgi:hypothetical protein
VLAAEPGNADARIAALVAADLAGDDAVVERLVDLPATTLPPSPLGRALLQELLLRRAGRATHLSAAETQRREREATEDQALLRSVRSPH